MNRRFIPTILIIGLALTACDLRISLPITQPNGPVTTDSISIPLPADTNQPTNLRLAFGAGNLKLHAGAASGSLVTGTATYNIQDFKPIININPSSVRIEQGNWRLTGIPDVSRLKNEWDLAIADAPIALSIDGGAYQATYDFGNLALTNLTVSDGAAEVKLDFSAPNQAEMALLSYSTGASNVSLTNLGNANFASLEFDSGAGNYMLDFSGTFKRDGSVHIGTGVSNLTIVVPEGLPTQITVKGALSNVTSVSGWTKNSNVYTQSGSGPQLTIVIEIGAGNVTITR